MFDIYVLTAGAAWVILVLILIALAVGGLVALIKYSEGDKEKGSFGKLFNEYAVAPAVGFFAVGLPVIAVTFIVDLIAYLINQI